jgi:hypothetical protein
MSVKSTIFYAVIPCSPVEVHWRFEGTYSLHILGWRVRKQSSERKYCGGCQATPTSGRWSPGRYATLALLVRLQEAALPQGAVRTPKRIHPRHWPHPLHHLRVFLLAQCPLRFTGVVNTFPQINSVILQTWPWRGREIHSLKFPSEKELRNWLFVLSLGPVTVPHFLAHLPRFIRAQPVENSTGNLINFMTVACKAVAIQWQRDGKIYQTRFWATVR